MKKEEKKKNLIPIWVLMYSMERLTEDINERNMEANVGIYSKSFKLLNCYNEDLDVFRNISIQHAQPEYKFNR